MPRTPGTTVTVKTDIKTNALIQIVSLTRRHVNDQLTCNCNARVKKYNYAPCIFVFVHLYW